MPRPCKRRRICSMPNNISFAPVGTSKNEHNDVINMTIDEYEAIRLIDAENMSQEECAKMMGVARTTAQAIYNSARKKLADFIVNGRELKINGGDYVLCEGVEHQCGHCCKKRCMHNIEN